MKQFLSKMLQGKLLPVQYLIIYFQALALVALILQGIAMLAGVQISVANLMLSGASIAFPFILHRLATHPPYQTPITIGIVLYFNAVGWLLLLTYFFDEAEPLDGMGFAVQIIMIGFSFYQGRKLIGRGLLLLMAGVNSSSIGLLWIFFRNDLAKPQDSIFAMLFLLFMGGLCEAAFLGWEMWIKNQQQEARIIELENNLSHQQTLLAQKEKQLEAKDTTLTQKEKQITDLVQMVAKDNINYEGVIDGKIQFDKVRERVFKQLWLKYPLRWQQGRITCKCPNIELKNTLKLKRGDTVICNGVMVSDEDENGNHHEYLLVSEIIKLSG